MEHEKKRAHSRERIVGVLSKERQSLRESSDFRRRIPKASFSELGASSRQKKRKKKEIRLARSRPPPSPNHNSEKKLSSPHPRSSFPRKATAKMRAKVRCSFFHCFLSPCAKRRRRARRKSRPRGGGTALFFSKQKTDEILRVFDSLRPRVEPVSALSLADSTLEARLVVSKWHRDWKRANPRAARMPGDGAPSLLPIAELRQPRRLRSPAGVISNRKLSCALVFFSFSSFLPSARICCNVYLPPGEERGRKEQRRAPA